MEEVSADRLIESHVSLSADACATGTARRRDFDPFGSNGSPPTLRGIAPRAPRPSDAERELLRPDDAGRSQRGNGYAQEADTLFHRILRPQQFDGNLLQRHAPFDHAAQRLTARHLLEVRVFDFQRHGATAYSGALAMMPDGIDDWRERVPRRLECEEVNGKRVLGTDGLADAVGQNRSVVDAACDPIIIDPRFTKVLLKERHGLRPQIETGFNPELVHLRRRCRADAVKLADRQNLDEGRSHLRRDDKEPVRLSVIGSKLCQKLVVRNP